MVVMAAFAFLVIVLAGVGCWNCWQMHKDNQALERYLNSLPVVTYHTDKGILHRYADGRTEWVLTKEEE